MGVIHGALGLPDLDNSYVNQVGQTTIYGATVELIDRFNQEIATSTEFFVDQSTDLYKWRFKTIGGGELQLRMEQTAPQAVKAGPGYEVALPLEDYAAQILVDDVTIKKMRLQELNRHVETVLNQGRNVVRKQILRALFNNVARTFKDQEWGDLIIQPFANGDGVLFEPTIGTSAYATENHFIVSNYLASAISDTNDPYAVIVAELEEHYGESAGGSNVVVLIHPDQANVTKAMTGFVDEPDRFIVLGDDTARPAGSPNIPSSARIIGRVSGAWVATWRWIPTGYMLGIHADAPAPLYERIDPIEQGFGRGLQLVAKDEEFPMESSFWRHRFGMGVVNRLNGVVVQLKASGSYDVPAALVY
ncbi:hypothetical protein EP7_005648 (plasmid) [Isosphaeraceae bacterium EP7]